MTEYPSKMPEEPTGELAIVKVGILDRGLKRTLGNHIYLVKVEGRWLSAQYSVLEYVWDGLSGLAKMGLTTYPLVINKGAKR